MYNGTTIARFFSKFFCSTFAFSCYILFGFRVECRIVFEVIDQRLDDISISELRIIFI